MVYKGQFVRVFKYRGSEFERDLETLAESYFWAPNRKNLNDPCEGLFDDQSINYQLELIFKLLSSKNNPPSRALESLKESLKDVFEFVDKSGVYSLSQTPLDDKYKDFTEYLYKAAEIVRREPDCNEVENVDFSTYKGSIENPVIFVQYKRKEHRYVTHHLSIQEIGNDKG